MNSSQATMFWREYYGKPQPGAEDVYEMIEVCSFLIGEACDTDPVTKQAAMYNLAALYEKQGERRLASKYYKMFMASDPDGADMVPPDWR